MDLVLAGVRPLSFFANRQKNAVAAILNEARKSVGCKHIGHVFTARGKSKDETFVSVTYPGKWLLNYALRSYFSIDPVIGHPSRTSRPIILNEMSAEDAAVKDLVDDARRYGLGRSFVSFPILPFSGNSGSVMFAFDMEYGRFQEFFDQESERLRAAARDIHISILRMRGFNVSQLENDTLNQMERGSLAMIAEGMSFADAAGKLGVSVTVFTACIASACSKLECRNAVHAVAKALAHGLIEIDVSATRPQTGYVPSQGVSRTPH